MYSEREEQEQQDNKSKRQDGPRIGDETKGTIRKTRTAAENGREKTTARK